MGETKVININYLIQYRVHSSTETYSLLVGRTTVIGMVLGGTGPRILAGKSRSKPAGWLGKSSRHRCAPIWRQLGSYQGRSGGCRCQKERGRKEQKPLKSRAGWGLEGPGDQSI